MLSGRDVDVRRQVEELVLAIHRRNGGLCEQLDFQLKLLDPALLLDSLDLAEVMVEVERRFRVRPFEAPGLPRTWADLVEVIVAAGGQSGEELPANC